MASSKDRCFDEALVLLGTVVFVFTIVNILNIWFYSSEAK